MTELLRILAEIPDLAAEAFATRDAPNPGPRTSGVRTIPDSRPPTDLAFLVVMDEGLDTLAMCVRMIDAEHPNTSDLPSKTWAAMCGYLVATFDWWSGQEGLAADTAHDLRNVHRTLQIQCRTPQPKYWCDSCGWALEDQPGGWMRCTGCGKETPGAAKVREHLQQAKPMTTGMLERFYGASLGVRADTVKKWAARGLIRPAGETIVDGRSWPTYEPWQVLQVMWRHEHDIDLQETS